MKRLLLAALLLVGCRDAVAPEPRAAYVVVLAPGAPTTEPGADYVFRHVLNGFVIRLTPAEATQLRERPGVLAVSNARVETQTTPWNLDRIDQRHLPLDGAPFAPVLGGAGVTVYVVDTGLAAHPDLAGRASIGYDAIGGNGTDCHGHGTHVAAIAAGSNWGVARGASVIAVRVLDCSGGGSVAGVIQGLDWVVQTANGPSIVNMSLGTSTVESALNMAVENVVEAGIPVVVAAGNFGSDACDTSPASVAAAITVAASGRAVGTGFDERAGFSSFGICVDLFAPGVDVESAWLNGGTATLSGTSMASPHVAGAVAIALELGDSALAVVRDATAGVVFDARSSNLLLYVPGTFAPPDSLRVEIHWPGHNHALWRDNSSGEDGFQLERSVDAGAHWQFVKLFQSSPSHFDLLIDAADLFRICALRGSVSACSGTATPRYVLAAPRSHQHGRIP